VPDFRAGYIGRKGALAVRAGAMTTPHVMPRVRVGAPEGTSTAMISGAPFRRLILGCALFVALVVAFDLVVLVAHRDAVEALTAALIGAALALAAVITIVVLVVTGQRRSQLTRQILAGDYLVRWHYAQGEWQQFVSQERTRSIRAALLFFPIVLACAALLALLSRVSRDPLLGSSILVLLLVAAVFLVGLVHALTGRRAFARRARLGGDTYISPLGLLRPDGYRPLQGAGYHLAAADVVPGRPSQLRFHLRLGRVGSLLALLGNTPAQWEARVPVPYGHETEAAQVAAQLCGAG
jgi:hypothetical protein